MSGGESGVMLVTGWEDEGQRHVCVSFWAQLEGRPVRHRREGKSDFTGGQAPRGGVDGR